MTFMGDDEEFKVLENQHKICCALDEDEKSGEKIVYGFDKKQIAEVTQLKTSDVTDMLLKYEQMKGFHQFLKTKRARNEPMPESREDLMMIYKIERPEFLQQKPNNWRRYAPKLQKMALYRKHS